MHLFRGYYCSVRVPPATIISMTSDQDGDSGEAEPFIPVMKTHVKPSKKRRKKVHSGVVTGKRSLLSKERHRRAIELRKAGATWQQIADQLGYSSAKSAYNSVRTAISNITVEPTTELIAIQYERLNHMLLTLWPQVQQGELAAMDRALRIMGEMNTLAGAGQHHARGTTVNVGINTGATNNVLVIEGDEQQYIAKLKQMAGVDPDAQLPTAQDHGLPELPPPVIATPGAQEEHTGGTEDEDTDPDQIIVDAEIIEDDPVCDAFVRPKDITKSTSRTRCARCGHTKGSHT